MSLHLSRRTMNGLLLVEIPLSYKQLCLGYHILSVTVYILPSEPCGPDPTRPDPWVGSTVVQLCGYGRLNMSCRNCNEFEACFTCCIKAAKWHADKTGRVSSFKLWQFRMNCSREGTPVPCEYIPKVENVQSRGPILPSRNRSKLNSAWKNRPKVCCIMPNVVQIGALWQWTGNWTKFSILKGPIPTILDRPRRNLACRSELLYALPHQMSPCSVHASYRSCWSRNLTFKFNFL